MDPEPVMLARLDTDDVARLAKLHPETVRRMIRQNHLPAVKVGSRWRVRREDVLALLAGEIA